MAKKIQYKGVRDEVKFNERTHPHRVRQLYLRVLKFNWIRIARPWDYSKELEEDEI